LIGPGLLFGRVSTLSLSGRGVRFSGGEWTIGGGAALAAPARLAPAFGVGLQADADCAETSFDVTLASASAVPTAELRFGTLSLYPGATAACARTEIIRPPTLLDPFPTGRPVSRTQLGPVFGAGLGPRAGLGGALSAGYREERPRATGSDGPIARPAWNGPAAAWR
jgi:hypothetical protein